METNSAGAYGGGIYNDGTLTADNGNGLMQGNVASQLGGGTREFRTGYFNAHCVTFEQNSARYGGGIYVDRGNVTCNTCTFLNNLASVSRLWRELERIARHMEAR